MLRFLENNDTYRFLREGTPWQRARPALAFLLLSPGIPYLFYGQEQGFRQSTAALHGRRTADPECRPDMFADGQYKFPSSMGDKFDTTSPLYGYVRRLLRLRQRHDCLRRGDKAACWADPEAAGLYVFRCASPSGAVIVALNTAPDVKAARMPHRLPDAATSRVLVDALDPHYQTPVDGSTALVSVPGLDVRALVLEADCLGCPGL